MKVAVPKHQVVEVGKSIRSKVKSIPIRQKSTSATRYSHALPQSQAEEVNDLTTLISDQVSSFSYDDLSDIAIHRSKKTILDIIGVGVIGSQTDISKILRDFAIETNGIGQHKSLIWGTQGLKMASPMAAYLNGASTHTMDFDDTWHPATHPSGSVLPAILALVDSLPSSMQPSLQDVLVAYNIGIQTQGALLRCSNNARNIPNRLHPPAIVGVMGSAAAISNLLGLGSWKCRHALAIASSFAGAPMANAGTMTKPLHAAKSARFGLEAALLSEKGIEGNSHILDMASGFGAYYEDYNPDKLLEIMKDSDNVLLHDQDVAIKRFPCHLGMHWGIDAAFGCRKEIESALGSFSVQDIKAIKITAPKSKYINRPIPETEHESRHSFQFTVCSALLDGAISPETFHEHNRKRLSLIHLLRKTAIETPDDNNPSFADMYVKVTVVLQSGQIVEKLCLTPYGHWRYPLSDEDVKAKFLRNTYIIGKDKQSEIIRMVHHMDKRTPAKELSKLLQI